LKKALSSIYSEKKFNPESPGIKQRERKEAALSAAWKSADRVQCKGVVMITKRSIVLACLCLTLTAGCTKRTPDLTRSKVQSLLEKTVIRNPDLNHGILLLHSDRLDIHWKLAYGTAKPCVRNNRWGFI
jgi:hypothetical protein